MYLMQSFVDLERHSFIHEFIHKSLQAFSFICSKHVSVFLLTQSPLRNQVITLSKVDLSSGKLWGIHMIGGNFTWPLTEPMLTQ